ncbi:hypothetical protein DY000_02015024 [Brassica cretica]|uniref:Uncharacterized protein n=1 Tax=Brassica cretica TaxID=69181 RepID=A0ABQ7D319_BRACR|nr:hypothetical protein DY000_02015024 [Brassica cretica]
MLGTTSPWVRPDSLAVDSPAHLGFWLSEFYVIFIAQGWFHNLLILFNLSFSLCSLISLVASLVALHFAMFATPGLDSVSFVYVLWTWKIISCLKIELWFLGG